MATVNEQLADEAISHSIDLTRYSNSVIRRIIALLNKTDRDLANQIAAALERLPAESFTGERLDALLQSVRQTNAAAYQQVSQLIETELKDLVQYESAYQYQLFQSTLPVQVQVAAVNVGQVYAAALARPFSISKDGAVPLNEYLKGIEANRAAKIRNAIRMGFIEGEPTDKIVRRIMGTKSLNYADGLMEESRRHVEGMVRTAVSHTADVTRQNFYAENNDLLKGWQFVATLDSRTSITCASLSGKIFPIGSGPRPPRHINCRSASVPIVKSWKELGIDLPESKASTRASMDGQISEDITFTKWLRSKPASVQDDILGATRGKLFRANKIEIDKFTDSKGRVISLDQLRKKNAEMFAKAGM